MGKQSIPWLLIGLTVFFFFTTSFFAYKYYRVKQQLNQPTLLTCQYNGKTYQDGETFPDKCNSCTCESGQIACTAMACE